MAKLVSDSGVLAVAHDGVEYRPDRKGVFEVPDQAAESLRAHGLIPSSRAAVAPEQEG